MSQGARAACPWPVSAFHWGMAKQPLLSWAPAGVSRPAQRALINAGFTALEQLAAATERDVAALHGMGPKALEILRNELAARGLSFRASPLG